MESAALNFGLEPLMPRRASFLLLVERHPWLPFVLPLAVFLLVGALEPTSPSEPGARSIGLALPYSAYPGIYTSKILLTVAALALVWPGLRRFPFRVTPLALIVGAVGVVVWLGLAELRFEQRVLTALGLSDWAHVGARSAFNPFEQLPGKPLLAYGFLAVRFFGLAVVVPLAEELFLRGFVMRAFVDPDWWEVPFGRVNTAAVVAGTIVPMLSHPELLAAAVWFSMVTWLMVRTRNLWDCIAAHAVTNLLLGIYVMHTGHWWLM